MVVCVLCAAGPNGRGVFWVQLGAVAGVFCVLLGAPTAGRVIGFRFILFVMRRIVPLCLILTAFFPLSPERAETLRGNLYFSGTMLMR